MALDYTQMNLGGARGERVDTRRMLLVAEALADLSRPRESEWQGGYTLEYLAEVLDIPQANDVSRVERAREMQRVWLYYPRDFLEFAFRYPPSWHLLTEAVRWAEVDRDDVIAYFRGRMEQRRAWPTIGALRAHFGRQSNHRPEAEKTPGQEALGVE